jgi:hypothetical protein
MALESAREIIGGTCLPEERTGHIGGAGLLDVTLNGMQYETTKMRAYRQPPGPVSRCLLNQGMNMFAEDRSGGNYLLAAVGLPNNAVPNDSEYIQLQGRVDLPQP